MPAPSRLGLWLPLHLALAGGASTAIAGVLPFFVADPDGVRTAFAYKGVPGAGGGAAGAGGRRCRAAAARRQFGDAAARIPCEAAQAVAPMMVQ